MTQYSVFLVQLLHTSQYHTLVYRNSFPQKQWLSIQSSSCSSCTHHSITHSFTGTAFPKTVTQYSVFLVQLLHTSQYHTLVYRNSFPQKQSLSIQSSSSSSCIHHSITHSFTGTAFPQNSHWVFILPRAAPAYITVSHTRLQEQLSPKTVTEYSVFLVQLLHTSQYHTLVYRNSFPQKQSLSIQSSSCSSCTHHSITHSFTGTAFPKNSHWVFSLPRAAPAHITVSHTRLQEQLSPKTVTEYSVFLVQLLHTSQYHTLVYRNSFPQKQSLSIQSSSCSSCTHHSITHSFTGTAFPKNSHWVFSLPRAAPAYITVSHTRLQEQLSPKTVTEYSVFLVQLLHTSQYHTLVYRNSFPQKQSLSIQSSSCSSCIHHSITHSFTGTAFPKNSHWVFSLPRAAPAYITVSHTRLQEQLSPKTVTEYSVFLVQLLHTSQYHTLVYRNSFPQKQSLSIQSSSCSSCIHHSITHSFTGTAFPKNSHWVFSLPRAAPAYITVSHTRLQEQLSPKTVTEYSVFLVQLLHTSQYHTLVYRNSFPQKQSLSIQSSSCSSCTHHSITHSFTGTAFPKNSHWVFSLPRAAPAHITVSHTRLQEQLSPKTVTEYSVFLVQLLHTSQYHTLVYRNSFPQKQSLSIQSSSCSSCTHHSITHSFTGTAFPKNSHWVFSLPRAAPAYITVSHTRLQEQLSPKTVTQSSSCSSCIHHSITHSFTGTTFPKNSHWVFSLPRAAPAHITVSHTRLQEQLSLKTVTQSSSCSSCIHHSITHSFTGTAFPKNSHWVFSLPRAAPAYITVSHTRLQEQLSPKTVTEYSVFLVQLLHTGFKPHEGDWMMIQLLLVNYTVKDT